MFQPRHPHHPQPQAAAGVDGAVDRARRRVPRRHLRVHRLAQAHVRRPVLVGLRQHRRRRPLDQEIDDPGRHQPRAHRRLLLAVVAAVPGRRRRPSGTVTGYARILDKDGNPLGVDQGSPNFGMDINDSPSRRGRSSRAGHRPRYARWRWTRGRSTRAGSLSVTRSRSSASRDPTFTLVGVVAVR